MRAKPVLGNALHLEFFHAALAPSRHHNRHAYEVVMKSVLAMIAGFLVLVGCGNVADAIDPVVRSGTIDDGTVTSHDTNGGQP